MDRDSFSLTFGVELEFIACYDPAKYQDKLMVGDGKHWGTSFPYSLHQKYEILVRLDMIKTLNDKGFLTNTELSQIDFSKWTVATDGTVRPTNYSSKNWCAIELKTPALKFSRPALEQVDKVVKLLVSEFKLYTNENCGLHVHVGNQNMGFTMPTLKPFCGLITAFEEQLNSLHPLDRLENECAKPVRMVFREGAPTREKLGIIASLNDVDGIISQFHGDDDKYKAYNFLNLNEGLENPLRTIEFRQHRGTLGPDMIVNWAFLVCVLVSLSHSNGEPLGNLIEKHIDDTEYTVVDLLKDLKLPDLANFYAPLVSQYSTQSPYETEWEREFVPRPPSEGGSENAYGGGPFGSIPEEDIERRPSGEDAAWDDGFDPMPDEGMEDWQDRPMEPGFEPIPEEDMED